MKVGDTRRIQSSVEACYARYIDSRCGVSGHRGKRDEQRRPRAWSGRDVRRASESIAILLTPSWVAGINRARTGTYMVLNALSAALWAVAIGVGGYYIGPPVLEFVDDFGAAGTVVAIALVVGAVTVAVLRRQRGAIRRRAQREAAS